MTATAWSLLWSCSSCESILPPRFSAEWQKHFSSPSLILNLIQGNRLLHLGLNTHTHFCFFLAGLTASVVTVGNLYATLIIIIVSGPAWFKKKQQLFFACVAMSDRSLVTVTVGAVYQSEWNKHDGYFVSANKAQVKQYRRYPGNRECHRRCSITSSLIKTQHTVIVHLSHFYLPAGDWVVRLG